MTDFLTHLAARSVNRLPVVQPRLASRFEASSEPNQEPQRASLRAVPEPNQPTLQRQPPNPTSTVTPRSEEKLKPLTFFEPEGLPSEPKGLPSEPKVLPSEPKGLPSEQKGLSSEPKGLSSEPKVLLSELKILPSELKGLLSEPKSLLSEPKGLPSEPKILPSELKILPSVGVRAPASIRPQIAPLPPVAAPTAEPPTIHVTIGRIEVRAQTSAPTTPPTTRRSAPALTLDQYLSQRGRP